MSEQKGWQYINHVCIDACQNDCIYFVGLIILIFLLLLFNMKEIENDDLICPITWEIFRDPVIAKDGHVYEREAITAWILQNGTSPLTREPLRIEDLQSDDHLRRLAGQQRPSIVSYNTSNQSTSIIMTRIHPEPLNIQHESNKFGCKQRIIIAICFCVIFIIILTLIIMAFPTFKNSSKTISRSHRYIFLLICILR
jgi:hypothetical protein